MVAHPPARPGRTEPTAQPSDRRRAWRAHPEPMARVDVTVLDDAGGTAACGRLLDISAFGLALATEDAILLAPPERVRLAFRLPGAAEPIELTATVRNRIPMDSFVRLGLEFDDVSSWIHPAARRQVDAYVHRRRSEDQREALEDVLRRSV